MPDRRLDYTGHVARKTSISHEMGHIYLIRSELNAEAISLHGQGIHIDNLIGRLNGNCLRIGESMRVQRIQLLLSIGQGTIKIELHVKIIEI